MDWNSSMSLKLWSWRNSGLRPVRPGSPRMWNVSLVRSGVNVWIMSLSEPSHLHHLLKKYFAYYHHWRTHLGLDKDAPQGRRVQLPEEGKIVAFPEVGGLHHHYERRAA